MKKLILAILLIISYFLWEYANERRRFQPTGPYSVGTDSVSVPNTTRKVQVWYPSTTHHGKHPLLRFGWIKESSISYYAMPHASHLKGKKFSVIILVPELGQQAQEYTLLCSEIASYGYIIIGIDLSHLTFRGWGDRDYSLRAQEISSSKNLRLRKDIKRATTDLKQTLKLLKQDPSILQYGSSYRAIIGVGAGVSIANLATYDQKLPLISILDPIGSLIQAEEETERYLLFLNNKSSVNAKYYTHWIKAMNNQEGRTQVGKKPAYKKWVEQKYLSEDSPPRDEFYLNYSEKGFKEISSYIIGWLKRKN